LREIETGRVSSRVFLERYFGVSLFCSKCRLHESEKRERRQNVC